MTRWWRGVSSPSRAEAAGRNTWVMTPTPRTTATTARMSCRYWIAGMSAAAPAMLTRVQSRAPSRSARMPPASTPPTVPAPYAASASPASGAENPQR